MSKCAASKNRESFISGGGLSFSDNNSGLQTEVPPMNLVLGTVSWDLTPCRLIEIYRSFSGICCFRPQCSILLLP